MNCGNCYFWSELIAMAKGCGPIEAMCLNENSDHYNQMTHEHFVCHDIEEGNGETIDAPI